MTVSPCSGGKMQGKRDRGRVNPNVVMQMEGCFLS